MSFSTVTLTCVIGKRSVSAAICASAVTEPWPISVSDRLTRTVPSEFIFTTAAVPVNDGIAGALCRVATPLPIRRPVRRSCSSSSAVSVP